MATPPYACIHVKLQICPDVATTADYSSYTMTWPLDITAGEWVRNCCVNLGVDPNTQDGRTINIRVLRCPRRNATSSALEIRTETSDETSTEWVYWRDGGTHSIGDLGLRDGDELVFVLLKPESAH